MSHRVGYLSVGEEYYLEFCFSASCLLLNIRIRAREKKLRGGVLYILFLFRL